jgi:hypothetical protein
VESVIDKKDEFCRIQTVNDLDVGEKSFITRGLKEIKNQNVKCKMTYQNPK